MNYIKEKISVPLDTNKTTFQRFESSFQMLSINIGWSGADANDGTFDLYVGTWDKDSPTSLKNLSQLGSQITLSSANSDSVSNISNYAGIFDAVRIVYTANANTEGTANLVIDKGA